MEVRLQKAELPQVNNRIKEITNAIQKPGSKEVDAPESTEDSTEVGEGDAKQEVAREDTPEGIQEEEVAVIEDQKVEEKPEVEERFETKRIKVTEPFTVGAVQVLFNEDGSIKSIINKSGKNKGKEVTPSTRAKYEKIILEKVIDVDSGEKAPVVEGVYSQTTSSSITLLMKAIMLEKLLKQYKMSNKYISLW